MLYDYKCVECEAIVQRQRKAADVYDPVECPVCAGECKRVILRPPVLSFDPISGDHTIATAKWEKHREKQMEKEKKSMKEHGTDVVPSRDFF